MIKEMKNVSGAVEYCLKYMEPCRSSDWLLICEVYRLMGIDVKTLSFEKLCYTHNKLNIPNFESIRRTRQKFQESGMYKASEDVQERRKIEEDAVHDFMCAFKQGKQGELFNG